jgi:hypothetical protein
VTGEVKTALKVKVGVEIKAPSIDHSYTVEPLYKHTIGNRICMLIREVCLCKGTVLRLTKKIGT